MFPLQHFPPLQFWPCRIFHFRIFSVPTEMCCCRALLAPMYRREFCTRALQPTLCFISSWSARLLPTMTYKIASLTITMSRSSHWAVDVCRIAGRSFLKYRCNYSWAPNRWYRRYGTDTDCSEILKTTGTGMIFECFQWHFHWFHQCGLDCLTLTLICPPRSVYLLSFVKSMPPDLV